MFSLEQEQLTFSFIFMNWYILLDLLPYYYCIAPQASLLTRKILSHMLILRRVAHIFPLRKSYHHRTTRHTVMVTGTIPYFHSNSLSIIKFAVLDCHSNINRESKESCSADCLLKEKRRRLFLDVNELLTSNKGPIDPLFSTVHHLSVPFPQQQHSCMLYILMKETDIFSFRYGNADKCMSYKKSLQTNFTWFIPLFIHTNILHIPSQSVISSRN